ncbi:tyrosine--tRNA ligase [Amphritea balenae]|uniref:Tyrosine--tRNA ligase n=1 Tax=Amphritea balenae TaxID=452629 RepID=A0A3P1SVT2_9GAMM|nr:tyrosine--tRNA ligase [Amphritea balenae]RRD01065.1 tyrosine--tRNA ligase [Amphritea balenae]GGK60225.1 tyrosine--tRNA ligase [Amphritea balenae]
MTDNNLIDDLKGRGLIAQQSGEANALNKHLSEPRTLYCGFDPTADSLHIGHLVPLLMLKRFQMAGHNPVALIGGATGMIGDPSFKATERSLNSVDLVDQWIEKIGKQLAKFIDFECSDNSAQITNNLDWMGQMDIMSFLRDIGKHFSVNAMIGKESVRQRIERPDQGISFTEFSYSLLQSYDFAVLNRDHNCSIQIGGNDQWGNITAGIDLTRRLNSNQVFGLTLPLITKADGTKFGKTESGAVWLDPAKTSPYSFYQFWINTADSDVYRFLRYYSFLPLTEIESIEAQDKVSGEKPKAQQILAEQMTLLVHGETALQQARSISEALFGGHTTTLNEAEFSQLALDGIPSSNISTEFSLTDALVESGLARSRRQAREFISSGAVQLNDQPASDPEQQLTPENAIWQRYQLLRRGRKNYHLFLISN